MKGNNTLDSSLLWNSFAFYVCPNIVDHCEWLISPIKKRHTHKRCSFVWMYFTNTNDHDYDCHSKAFLVSFLPIVGFLFWSFLTEFLLSVCFQKTLKVIWLLVFSSLTYSIVSEFPVAYCTPLLSWEANPGHPKTTSLTISRVVFCFSFQVGWLVSNLFEILFKIFLSTKEYAVDLK